MEKPIHILNQTGVLASFSVAKKITEEDMDKYFTKQQKLGKTEEQMSEMLQDKIIGDIQEAILNNKIPGLISSQGMDQSVIDKMPEINRLVMIIVQKLAEKKYDKMSLCYFINSVVNMLNLTERDFERFHREADEDEDEFGED